MLLLLLNNYLPINSKNIFKGILQVKYISISYYDKKLKF